MRITAELFPSVRKRPKLDYCLLCPKLPIHAKKQCLATAFQIQENFKITKTMLKLVSIIQMEKSIHVRNGRSLWPYCNKNFLFVEIILK